MDRFSPNVKMKDGRGPNRGHEWYSRPKSRNDLLEVLFGKMESSVDIL
jgi:hypothetical protein